MSRNLIWKTVQRRVSDLKGMPHNPRRLTEKQETDLRKSLEQFNLVDIPAIDTDGTIVGGHQRVKVLLALGREKERIDVRIPNRKLTASERRELNIRLNKNMGEWDEEVLREHFEIEELERAGFTRAELEDLSVLEETAEEKKKVSFDVKKSFDVIAKCTTKHQQTKVYRMLMQAGVECKRK